MYFKRYNQIMQPGCIMGLIGLLYFSNSNSKKHDGKGNWRGPQVVIEIIDSLILSWDCL